MQNLRRTECPWLFGFWPILNNLHFVIGHNKSGRRKNISLIFYWLRMKYTLLCFGIKASFMEVFEYLFHILAVCRHIIWVDKYIVQIDYNTDIQKIRENFILSSKSSLLFVPIGNMDQMVYIAKFIFIYTQALQSEFNRPEISGNE